MFEKKSRLYIKVGAVLLSVGGLLACQVSASELTDKCDECHGKGGNATDEMMPTIAGFSAVTIEDIMVQFKDGDREGLKYKKDDGTETDMNEIARKLSDDDIKAVSAYYSKQSFKPRKQSFDAKLAKRGAKVHDKRCEKCHSEGGSNADDDAAILAGQARGYMEKQFELIKAGDRHIPKKMKKKFKKVKDKDYQALIEFYISQQ